MQTWSALPVLLGNVTNYDFSTNALQAYGNNMIFTYGVWAFYSGDLNQDENIDLSDFPYWDDDNVNFVFGYFPTDINGDINVDLSDFPYWYNNNANFIYSNHS